MSKYFLSSKTGQEVIRTRGGSETPFLGRQALDVFGASLGVSLGRHLECLWASFGVSFLSGVFEPSLEFESNLFFRQNWP